MHVGSLRCRRQIADRHVLDHAATQRAHLGHRVLLSVDRASTTTILSDGRPSPRRPPYLPRKRVSSISPALWSAAGGGATIRNGRSWRRALRRGRLFVKWVAGSTFRA